jgi:hypothetical protein
MARGPRGKVGQRKHRQRTLGLSLATLEGDYVSGILRCRHCLKGRAHDLCRGLCLDCWAKEAATWAWSGWDLNAFIHGMARTNCRRRI